MFFKKDTKLKQNINLVKVAALLIYAAKIDENFSKEEEEIIKKTIYKLSTVSEDTDEIINKAKIMEENTNQILDFTKEIKAMDEEDKLKIIETLWEIIYSNKKADIYETNLMRRLAGLLYIDNKIMGDIKEKIKKT